MLALWIILMLLLLLVGLTIAAPYDPWTLNSSRVGCLTSLRLHLSAVAPNKDTHTHTHSLTRDKTNKYILPALTCMWYLTVKTNSSDFLMPVESNSQCDSYSKLKRQFNNQYLLWCTSAPNNWLYCSFKVVAWWEVFHSDMVFVEQ